MITQSCEILGTDLLESLVDCSVETYSSQVGANTRDSNGSGCFKITERMNSEKFIDMRI